MKNREKEIVLLMALDTLDMGWIARDEDGMLWAFESEPGKGTDIVADAESDTKKVISCWYDPAGGREFDLSPFNNLFDGVIAEDEKATVIKDLLLRKAGENPTYSWLETSKELSDVFTRAAAQKEDWNEDV